MADQSTTIQSVTGRVRDVEGGVSVEIGPLSVGPGETRYEVEFDRPVSIPLSALFPDPEQRGRIEDTVGALLTSTETRFDELMKVAGLDAATDLAGSNLSGFELDGSPERPLDMRGWDLTGADLSGCVVGTVLVDDTTRLDGARLDGITGPGAPALLAIAPKA